MPNSALKFLERVSADADAETAGQNLALAEGKRLHRLSDPIPQHPVGQFLVRPFDGAGSQQLAHFVLITVVPVQGYLQ